MCGTIMFNENKYLLNFIFSAKLLIAGFFTMLLMSVSLAEKLEKYPEIANLQNINIFEVKANPNTISIEKGSSGTIDITINREDGFAGQVNLSIFPSPGLPAGVTAPFTPSSVPGNSSNSVLTLQVGETAASGTFNVVVAGTGNKDGTTFLRTVSVSLTITDPQPPGIVASFNFLEGNNILAGLGNISNNITLDQQDLPDVINFSANTSGAVTAVEWTFKEQGSANTIQTYTDNTTPYTLYPSGGWTVSPGVYELQAVQINNSDRGDAKRILITIESAPPPTFTVNATPAILSVFQGESVTTEIILNPVNNFSGAVDLVTNNLPEGVQGFFSITTLNTEGKSNLRFEADERAPVGSYSIEVRAMGPNQLEVRTTVDLTITRAFTPDFELSVNPNNLNIIRSESGRVSLTVKPLDGFNKAVSFEASTSDNLVSFDFNPSTIENGNGSTELTIFTLEEIELGLVEITIFAFADTIERSVNLALTIDPIPIELKPKNQFSPNGDGIDDVWVIEEIFEVPNYTVVVFDRSGKEVFKAQPYKNDWNGKNRNGVDLLPTTYFFTIKDGDGRVVKTGSLNLLR